MLKWDKIDLCKFAEDFSSYPFVNQYIINLNEEIPGLIEKCPRKKLTTNFTLSFSDKIFAPSGVSQVIVCVYNNRDKNIITIVIDLVINIVK